MADELSPAERAAIAAYKGPVTRIPQGQASALAERMAAGLHWRDRQESSRRMFARSQRFAALKRREEVAPVVAPKPAPVLVMVTPPTVTKLKRVRTKRAMSGVMAEKSRASAVVRERVLVLVREGVSWRQAAVRLDISLGMVGKHIKRLRADGLLPPVTR